jgi:DNA-binding response OmpR family regulator
VEERDFVRGWELGADEYMTKPFEPERLARKLEELLHTPPDMLRKKREAELQKAELLDRLESAFNRPRPVRY